MNREIKFRAKSSCYDEKSSKWVYGMPVQTQYGNWLMLDINGCKHADFHNVIINNGNGSFIESGWAMPPKTVIPIDGETICQFTGLIDKNDEEIYEGDIVKTKLNRLCAIKRLNSNGFSGFDMIPIEFKHKMPSEYDLYASYNLEVVGNIYDNKDMIKINNKKL